MDKMQRAERIEHSVKNPLGQTLYDGSFGIQERKELMSRRELIKIDTRIKTVKKAAQELKKLSGSVPAVNRNAERILASVKMLEINISDILDLRF
jgi:hypothetical protein